MPRVATTINISNPKRYGYDVRIDDILLRSAVGPGREMQIQSSDVQEGQINVKQNPEDFTSNLGRIYSRNNFTGGQGLDTAHRANGSPKDTTRFFDSKGVDVFHGDDETSYHVHLLHTTAEELNFSNSNNYLAQTTNGDMYVTDGTTIYKSTDNAASWTLQSDSPNILGRATDGTGTGGQSWYDLSLVVSTEDETLLYVGGINLWKSVDGGVNWNISGSSGNGSNYSYMHVDQHALEFNPLNGIAYAGNDGGLYEYMDTLNSWVDISDGLAISQFYKLGLSNTLNSRVVAGAQDNGTEMTTNGVWDAIRGADGMECAIDIYDEDIIYSTSQYGGLRKSYNGGNNWNNIQPVNYSGAWVTPWKVHPINNNIIVAGYDEIYRSQTGGGQWDSISYNVSNGASVRTIALAASDEDYIYSASLSKIKRTKDAGATWVDIKQGLANFNFSDITVDYFDADHVFVTYSEFQANHKVYESFDGGDSWVNITGNGLPNLPVNCIVYQKQANGDIYVGTDVGVYHKDNTMTDWVPYMNGLPNVVVNELEINYNTQKIVAATFGRGIWESDLNTNSTNTYNASFSKIGIYPNPAKDMISIMGINNNNVAVNIYNITGQKVLSINNPINNEIALNSLKKGCYFIEIRGEKIPPITEKLIKE